MAARKGPSFAMSNEHRVKIQNSNILNALIEHACGEREMSPSQVTAGLGLIRKVLPDLSSSTIEHEGQLTVHTTKEQRDAAVAAATRANS